MSGPIKVEEMPPAEIERLVEAGFKGYTKLVKSNPGGIIMSPRYADTANKIRNFEFRPDDVIVMTYPKSGTTWLQEIVWAMKNIHQLHLAEKDPISARSYFIDADGLYSLEHQLTLKSQLERFNAECPGQRAEDGIVLQLAGASKRPRIIKTHLPASLYPPNLLDTCKVIYVCRDPKDVCVSYCHHCRRLRTYQFEGTFDQFAKAFMEDDLYYGSYWDHVTSAWQLRSHKNLHFIFYEDLQQDSLGQLKDLNDFLGTNLNEEQLKTVADHASFENMKTRDKIAPMTFSSPAKASEGSFFRKGVVGDWKNVASTSLQDCVQGWMKKNISKLGSDFYRYL